MRTSIQRAVLFVAACAACAAFAGSAFAAGDDYAKAVKAALPYTVSMVVENRQGSGFIIKSGADYYVITSSAIVNQMAKVTVETSDGKQYETELRGVSPGAGVAVLKMNFKGVLAAARFGDSKKLEVGEKVIAVGRPQGYGFCVTAGIVSGTYRVQAQAPAEGGQGPDIDFIQTDAAINPGQVGGPLVNLDGDVVGMCITFTGGAEQPNPKGLPPGTKPLPQMGLDIALPIDSIEDAIKQLIHTGGVMATARDFGFGGMQDVNADTMQKLKLANKDGALVFSVIKDSPAEQAGIQSNDVIIEFNGKPVKNADDLKALAQSVSMGTKVTVKFVGMRENKPAQGSAEIQLPKPEGGISNGSPSEADEVAQADDAAAGGPAIAAKGLPITSAGAAAGNYVGAVNHISPQVITLENGGSAVLLPKSVAPGADARYLLTAAHLVQNRDGIKVIFYKGAGAGREAVPVDGTIVGTDPKNDIAVIKISSADVPGQLSMADAGSTDYGTEVVAVGHGVGFTVTATAGVISVKGFHPREELSGNFCVTSARLVPANDGGALVDRDGRFVGLCTRISAGSFKNGAGLFIPAGTAIAAAKALIAGGKAKAGYIGIESFQDISQVEKEKYKISGGVEIVKVTKGGPADKAGLKEGDIILKFGDTAVQNREQLTKLAAGLEAGKTITLSVMDAKGNVADVKMEVAEKE